MKAFGIIAAIGIGLCIPASARDVDRDPFAAYEAGAYAEALAGAEAALADDADNPVWWALAGEAQAALGRPGDAADSFGRAALSETDAARRSYYLRAQTYQMVLAGESEEAKAVVARAMAERALQTRGSLDWALVAMAAGDDASAQAILADPNLHAGLTRQSALDAAYSAKRLGVDERAAQFFRLGLTLDKREEVQLPPEGREQVRREIRELERVWSVTGQASYSSAGRPDGLVPVGDDEALQVGAELSRRLGGWRNGRPFSVFARVFHSEFMGAEGGRSAATQGWVGARYKPFAAVDFNIEASRLAGLVANGIDDWSLRTAISTGEGLEPETGRGSWTYWRAYADASYLIENDTAYGLAEARYGRSFALGDASVLTPYAVARAGLDTGRAEDGSFGAGAGLSLRYWYAATDTVAARGFIEFDIQAREGIAGNSDAGGVLASITVGR